MARRLSRLCVAFGRASNGFRQAATGTQRLIWLTVALGLLTAVLAADVVRHWLG
jgi:hypothetical protein